MSQYVLSSAIISRSVATTWDSAKMEWELERIYMDSEKTCLCSHYPISEICVLKNRKNGVRAVVGNCCVQKFMSISSDKLFSAIKRVKKDRNRSVNAEVAELAHKKGYITDWELSFYLDTWRKKKMTEKQMIYRRGINEKILSKMRL